MLLRWWYLLLPEPGDWVQEASFFWVGVGRMNII